MDAVLRESLAKKLQHGLVLLNLDLSFVEQEKLLNYLALLVQWNKVYNLTAVKSLEEMLVVHVMDCLAVINPLKREVDKKKNTNFLAADSFNVLDVGSGGGLPGVVLAICMPNLNVYCIDTVFKKAAFIQHAAGLLGLERLKSIHARVETLVQPFDFIISRAFSSLENFLTLTRNAMPASGLWIAMKGQFPGGELEKIPKSVKVFHVEQLEVPFLSMQRCLVWMGWSEESV